MELTNAFRKLGHQSLFAGLHYLAASRDSEKADEFFSSVATGIGLPGSTSPAYVLRERLLKDIASKDRLRRKEVAALAIKAWNAEVNGEELLRVNWRASGKNPEQFPTLAA